jgi:hypothetical protein
MLCLHQQWPNVKGYHVGTSQAQILILLPYNYNPCFVDNYRHHTDFHITHDSISCIFITNIAMTLGGNFKFISHRLFRFERNVLFYFVAYFTMIYQ